MTDSANDSRARSDAPTIEPPAPEPPAPEPPAPEPATPEPRAPGAPTTPPGQPAVDGPEQWVEMSQGLVRSLAYGIHKNLPKQVSVEDLIGYGQIGLLQAAKAYRADYETSFPTFAYYRIRGAMLDGVGKMAWVNRADQRRFKAQRAAHEALAEQAEGAAGPADPGPAAAGWLVAATEKLAVVQLLSRDNDDGGPSEIKIEDRSQRPDEQAATDEMRNLLTAKVKNLPDVERSLITMTYYDGLSLADAARALGRSKSWASRLHSQILQRLAQSVKSLDPT